MAFFIGASPVPLFVHQRSKLCVLNNTKVHVGRTHRRAHLVWMNQDNNETNDPVLSETIRIMWYGDSASLPSALMTKENPFNPHPNDPVRQGMIEGLGEYNLLMSKYCIPCATFATDDRYARMFSRNREDFNISKVMARSLGVPLSPHYTVLQLGINDLRDLHKKTIEQVIEDMKMVVTKVIEGGSTPFLISPQLVDFEKELETQYLTKFYVKCRDDPVILAKLYKDYAREIGIPMFNGTLLGSPEAGDGGHLSWGQSLLLGFEVGQTIRIHYNSH